MLSNTGAKNWKSKTNTQVSRNLPKLRIRLSNYTLLNSITQQNTRVDSGQLSKTEQAIGKKVFTSKLIVLKLQNDRPKKSKQILKDKKLKHFLVIMRELKAYKLKFSQKLMSTMILT